jgi:hypothetical protein
MGRAEPKYGKVTYVLNQKTSVPPNALEGRALTLLGKAGVEQNSFGDSTGTISL